MSDKQRLEALAEGEKRKALLDSDLKKLQEARKKINKLMLESLKIEESVAMAPRYETKADAGLSLCYALNVTANLKRLLHNVDKMMETVKEERRSWETTNPYLNILNAPKRKAT